MKRECGTCRFFEASGIGESGWCRNMRCKDIVGIALVRRQELACRIGWNDDYYEPVANPADALPGENRAGADAVRQRTGYQGTRPDDIIVGIEQPRPVTEQEPMPGPRSRMSNVGEAHRRALERRQIAQQSGDEYAPRRLDPPPVQPTPDASASGSPPGEPYRRPGMLGDEGVSAPRRVDPMTMSIPAEDPNANTAPFAIPRTAVNDRPSEQPHDTAWPPEVPAAYVAYQPPVAPQPPGYVSPQGEYAPAPLPPNAEPQRSAIDAEWEAQERQRHRGKRCANCRHFQAAESGDRGWCRNRFAFPTPQLVGPNDLACLTGIGAWWAANDQWWLAKAGLPAQPGPTPLADAVWEEMQEQEKRRGPFRRPSTG
jgi:hypothetical protein